jgi:hypothetical protein
MGRGKEAGVGRGRKREARDIAADALQPVDEPASGEAGMTGHNDALAPQSDLEIQQGRISGHGLSFFRKMTGNAMETAIRRTSRFTSPTDDLP